MDTILDNKVDVQFLHRVMSQARSLNASLLKVAELTLSKIYTETGFVGAPLAGTSRAERAPHLSNS